MNTAEKIHQYIKANKFVENGVKIIDGEHLRFVFDGEGLNRKFNKSPPSAPQENRYRFVLVGTKINHDSFMKFPLYRPTPEVLIENALILYDIEFNGVVFENNFVLTIEDTYKASISFTNCHFRGKLKIRNKENNDYEKDCPDKTKLNSLKFIDCTMGGNDANDNPYLRVGFLDVDEFVLKNLRVPNNAEVNIGDCHFKNFHLSNFRNLGKFKLYKINIQKGEKNCNGVFQLDNTSIGDADFQRINLVSFEKRVIFDNILSGINYTNMQWEEPRTDIEVGESAPESRTEIAKKRDTYRVLKNVAQSNNDMQQASAFYVKEMKWHSQLIKRNTKLCEIKQLYKSKELNKLLDRVILFFWRYTNNYGQNWLWPIILILILGVAFYGMLLCVLTGDVFDGESWSKFFLFLNPTHSVEFVHKYCWGGGAYFLDFLFRILEGSLIYQSIQAFRKYSRRF